MASFFFTRHKSAPAGLAGIDEPPPPQGPTTVGGSACAARSGGGALPRQKEPSACELLLNRLKQQKHEPPAFPSLKRKSAPSVPHVQNSRSVLPAKVSAYFARASVERQTPPKTVSGRAPAATKAQRLPVETVKMHEAHREHEPSNKKILLNALDNFLCSPTPPSQKDSAEPPTKQQNTTMRQLLPLQSTAFGRCKTKVQQPQAQARTQQVSPKPSAAQSVVVPAGPKLCVHQRKLERNKTRSLEISLNVEMDMDLFCVIGSDDDLDETSRKCVAFSDACSKASHGVVVSVVLDGKASSFRTVQTIKNKQLEFNYQVFFFVCVCVCVVCVLCFAERN